MNAEVSSAGAEQQTSDQGGDAEEIGLQSLGQLLQDSEPTDESAGVDDQQGDSGSDKDTKLTKFNDLAGRLETDLDELYALEVSLDESDEPVTIEMLKDHYKDRGQHELERIEFEEHRAEQTQELMRANQELQEILELLPKNAVAPEVLAKVREKHEATRTVELKKTLQVIPEWNDADRRQADIAAMADHLAAYGFPIDYLKQVVNHQQLRYIRDNWMREQRMKKALEAVRAAKPKKQAGTTPASQVKKRAQPVGGKSNAPNKLAEVFSNLE